MSLAFWDYCLTRESTFCILCQLINHVLNELRSRSTLLGGFSLFIGIVFFLFFPYLMILIHREGCPQKNVFPPVRKHYDIVRSFLGFEPNADPGITLSLLRPYFQTPRITLLNNRLRPTNAFTAPQIGGSILLVCPLVSEMIEGTFLPVYLRQSFEPNASIAIDRFASNKIIPENLMHCLDVSRPISVEFFTHGIRLQ